MRDGRSPYPASTSPSPVKRPDTLTAQSDTTRHTRNLDHRPAQSTFSCGLSRRWMSGGQGYFPWVSRLAGVKGYHSAYRTSSDTVEQAVLDSAPRPSVQVVPM